jgi:hypothetical protein
MWWLIDKLLDCLEALIKAIDRVMQEIEKRWMGGE